MTDRAAAACYPNTRNSDRPDQQDSLTRRFVFGGDKIEHNYSIPSLPKGIDEYVRKIEDAVLRGNSEDELRSTHSDDAENFTDPTFDSELAQFKMRMDGSPLRKSRRRKLVPNVSPCWLSLVRYRLQAL